MKGTGRSLCCPGAVVTLCQLPCGASQCLGGALKQLLTCTPLRECDQHRVLASVCNVPSTNIMHTCLLNGCSCLFYALEDADLPEYSQQNSVAERQSSASSYGNLLLYTCCVPELLALANSLRSCQWQCHSCC